MKSLFPNIREALRGTLVKEEMPTQNDQQSNDQQQNNNLQKSDPLDLMDPRERQNYQNELQKLIDQENGLRQQIDKVKQQKIDLKKKYKLPA